MLDLPFAWLAGIAAGRTLLLAVVVYLAVFAVTILIVVGMLATLPATYFRDGTPPRSPGRGGGVAAVARVTRNAAGLVLIVLGFLLSLPAVPGQGLLTILIGLMLIDVPGKRRLERRLVARRGIFEALNRLRACCGRPPFVL
jgi:hypothetical protein